MKKDPKTSSELIMERHRLLCELNFSPGALKNGERRISILPAFEARDPDPSKDFGIHGCELHFAVRLGDSAASTIFNTGWFLPELRERMRNLDRGGMPTCWGIVMHRTTPSSGDDSIYDDCHILGGKCYTQYGSMLYGDTIAERLVREGASGVWDELENAISPNLEELL